MALKDLADWGSKVSSCGGDKPSACGGKKSVSCGGDKPSACGGKKQNFTDTIALLIHRQGIFLGKCDISRFSGTSLTNATRDANTATSTPELPHTFRPQ